MLLSLLISPLLVASAPQPGPSSYELHDYNPIANSGATVISGNARFTVLTDRVIRMEYSGNGKFEDRPTLAFLNRNTDIPKFTKQTSNGQIVISTSAIELHYTVGKAFSKETLSIVSKQGTGATDSMMTKWTYGDANTGNLLGTIKSLDQLGVVPLDCNANKNITVHGESLHCEWGLVSRAGWAVVNDTDNWALTKGAEWWDSVNTDDEDLYMFMHGHDYKGALMDFTQLAGNVAMAPRYANGLWWTRWYDVNSVDIRHIVQEYEFNAIPLDVFILDMDWHKKDNWGGYTFDEHLFIYPEIALSYLKKKGLHIGANLHDANGVGSYDKQYEAMSKALNNTYCKKDVCPFSMVNKDYVYALEDIVLLDVEKMGMDLWWIDWQQGGTQGGCAGGKQNPTIWTDKIRATDHKRRGNDTRGLILARWGGLGTHRYQVGFSGDVAGLKWENLAFQPYFTLTSSNVAYGSWSHDIEGPSDDLEMYVRWVQWAAYSPVFRSHDRGMSGGGCYESGSCSIVRPYNVPLTYRNPIRNAMTDRAELLPYIYTAQREAYDTGVSLLRPMYYEFPESDMAYAASPTAFQQYFFGSANMFVAPVVVAADNVTNLAKTSIWVPPGKWIEKCSGAVYDGSTKGMVVNNSYHLNEIPVFVKAGAVIPTRPLTVGQTTGKANEQYGELQFSIYPEGMSGEGKVYEDDGKSVGYLKGEYAYTVCNYTSNNGGISATISSTGSFPEMVKERLYSIVLVNAVPPSTLTLNGKDIPMDLYTMRSGETSPSWRYDGNTASLIVHLGQQSTSDVIKVEYTPQTGIDSVAGIRRIFSHALLAKGLLDEARITLGAHKPVGGHLMSLSSIGDALTVEQEPTKFATRLASVKTTFADAMTEVKNMTGSKKNQDLIQPAFALLESCA